MKRELRRPYSLYCVLDDLASDPDTMHSKMLKIYCNNGALDVLLRLLCLTLANACRSSLVDFVNCRCTRFQGLFFWYNMNHNELECNRPFHLDVEERWISWGCISNRCLKTSTGWTITSACQVDPRFWAGGWRTQDESDGVLCT